MLLDRRTFDGAIGAKHAAIAFLGFQQSPARLAKKNWQASVGMVSVSA